LEREGGFVGREDATAGAASAFRKPRLRRALPLLCAAALLAMARLASRRPSASSQPGSPHATAARRSAAAAGAPCHSLPLQTTRTRARPPAMAAAPALLCFQAASARWPNLSTNPQWISNPPAMEALLPS